MPGSPRTRTAPGLPEPRDEVLQSRELPVPPYELETRLVATAPNCRGFLDALRVRAAESGSHIRRRSHVESRPHASHSRNDAVTAAAAVAGANALGQRTLAQARAIKAEITARYVRQGGPKLVVTEASATSVIESFLLLSSDLLELRVVPADNGIHYAICPARATCPYPGPRAARPASAFVPRRQALELAVRTFIETSAAVVSVSLPTRDYVFFLVERDELQGFDMAALAKAWPAILRVRLPARCDARSTRSHAPGCSCRSVSKLPRADGSLSVQRRSGARAD